MSLIVYECQRAGHAHEIRQFGAAAQSLYDYFDGRDETALFIGKVNIGEANLDGLITKNDAVVIVEFKDYEGDIIARQNGEWMCDNKTIKGGAGGKTVFEQLKKNQRILRRVIGENNYLTEVQRSDIKGLVVFTKLKSYSDDFDRTNKSWIYVSDLDNMGNVMRDILSSEFKDYKTGRTSEVSISDEDIFSFLRKIRIDESALVTDFSDTSIMPQDLFDKNKPHNGKHYSTAIMTYHSAKGLQFETVILPFYEGANDKETQKALYVAMTRTYRYLYVMYSGGIISKPLQNVPSYLYKQEL